MTPEKSTGILLRTGMLCSLLLLTLIFGCQEVPVARLDRAKLSIQDALKSGAQEYARSFYDQAESLFTAGMTEIARQKASLTPFRDYERADSLLRIADSIALQAKLAAIDSLTKAQANTAARLSTVSEELQDWEEQIDGSLSRVKLKANWYRAHTSYTAARSLLKNKEYDEAMGSLAKSEYWLERLEATVRELQERDIDKLPVWRRWVQETLDQSARSNGYAIIVDKIARKTYLVKDGRLFHTYSCDLGYNSGAHKLLSGDGATPEGKYQVTELKHNSRFYKALPINYPNESDKKRFAENKAKGIIPKRARIGGYIQIHGEGGQDKDWTEGCVALTNKEMDHIFKYATVGTPVTIVRTSDRWP